MPVVIEPLERSVTLPHKLWTRAECEALERAGLIDYARFELLEGELVPKMGKNQPHMSAAFLLIEWLRSVFGYRFVAEDATIDLRPEDTPTSAPEPDAIVLNKIFPQLKVRAAPSDIRFAAEVADTSIDYDLTGKARLYARSGIAEYWVVDVNERCVHVHREPVDGRYRLLLKYGEHERVATILEPTKDVRVGDLFEIA